MEFTSEIDDVKLGLLRVRRGAQNGVRRSASRGQPRSMSNIVAPAPHGQSMPAQGHLRPGRAASGLPSVRRRRLGYHFQNGIPFTETPWHASSWASAVRTRRCSTPSSTTGRASSSSTACGSTSTSGAIPSATTSLLALAGERIAAELTPGRVDAPLPGRDWRTSSRSAAVLRGAELDALIVVGDDQKELYQTDNLPSVLVYHGETIRNVPLKSRPGPDVGARRVGTLLRAGDAARLSGRRAAGAAHREPPGRPPSSTSRWPTTWRDGRGEGHAFGFVHRRLLNGDDLPVVPIFLNTYYPPNQPTPRRCHRLGQAIRAAVEGWPGDERDRHRRLRAA